MILSHTMVKRFAKIIKDITRIKDRNMNLHATDLPKVPKMVALSSRTR